jgi:hypothetical protein
MRHSRAIETPMSTSAPPPEPAEPEAAGFSTDAVLEVVAQLVAELEDKIAGLGERCGKQEAEIAGLKLANAELKAELSEVRARCAEVTAKSNETSFVVARLRLDHRGDVGPQGLMGRDGAPGPAGPRGEKGDRGNRGAMGRTPTSWEISPGDWTATIVFENGELGPVLNLHPFFAEYDEAVGNAEETNIFELETERAMAERARDELEILKLRR